MQLSVTKEEVDNLKKDYETKGLFRIQVKKANLYKCPRCWVFAANEEDKLCVRCDKVLKMTNE